MKANVYYLIISLFLLGLFGCVDEQEPDNAITIEGIPADTTLTEGG
ncbi:hypothetical protein [Algoriphagus chordae]|uniref:Uncharacterized protein n=1 Tax=Algoriphagus chordae TaxID=237019 RepID=A0A2W7QYJ7_9BACT|nr:hypothetical protein [Algoriphagus chordae]PZX46839.1 hypothetical protein LV85_04173 [Algoriphagus chordae]